MQNSPEIHRRSASRHEQRPGRVALILPECVKESVIIPVKPFEVS
jgi:hypothetical protein